MHIGAPRIAELFQQLGLPSTETAITAFIELHRPESLGCALAEAPVWSAAQAQFLREAIAADAEWALPAEWLAAVLCHPETA